MRSTRAGTQRIATVGINHLLWDTSVLNLPIRAVRHDKREIGRPMNRSPLYLTEADVARLVTVGDAIAVSAPGLAQSSRPERNRVLRHPSHGARHAPRDRAVRRARRRAGRLSARRRHLVLLSHREILGPDRTSAHRSDQTERIRLDCPRPTTPGPCDRGNIGRTYRRRARANETMQDRKSTR